MRRYLVAFIAVVLGGAVAAADIAVALPMLPPQPRGVPRKKSPEEDRLLWEACVTFYGIAYSTGRFLYRLLGASSEEQDLRGWSRSHMMLLNVLGGCWLIVSGWPALQLAVLRPSLVVGALLVVLSAIDGYKGLLSLRRE